MNDWLKGLKVGDLVYLSGTYGYCGGGSIIKITGETSLYWKAGNTMFRKDNGRIRGAAYSCINEATPEVIARFRTAFKRRTVGRLAKSTDKLTESDLDAIIAIFERAGK